MDVSIYIESWREGIKHGMRREPLVKKLCVSCGGLVTLIICLVLGSYQMVWWKNVLVI